MQFAMYAERPAVACSAVNGPVAVWATAPACQKPRAAVAARSASTETVFFPPIVMDQPPSTFDRVWLLSRPAELTIAAQRDGPSGLHPEAKTSDRVAVRLGRLCHAQAGATPTDFRLALVPFGC